MVETTPSIVARIAPSADTAPDVMVDLNLTPRGRVLRLVVALTLLVVGWRLDLGLWSHVARVLALYPLVLAIVGWSPLRALSPFRGS